MSENPPGAPPAPPKKSNVGVSSKFNSPFFLWPAAVVLAVILFFGINYVLDFMTHESTDDAFIAAHIVSVAPRIAGQVTAVHVLDNQLVRANDLLVEIDPADFAAAVAQKNAAAISQEANLRTVIAGYELMRAKVVTAQSSMHKAQDDAEAAEATANRAQQDFNRAQGLLKAKTISQQEFDSAQAANDTAQAGLKSARENVAEENSKVAEADKQLLAILAEKDVVLAQVSEAKTNVAAASLTLSYTKIFAPSDGRITRKAVEAGDYLQAAQQILSIVPPEVWVVANFKESQLAKMKTNQPVSVEIDALGGKTFRAHVDSVQAGSGAQFSLLPPENAVGNFVKVVQRVPVKIVFDDALPPDHVLGPGLSVTPSVEIGTINFPAWLAAIVAIFLAILIVLAFRFFLNRE